MSYTHRFPSKNRIAGEHDRLGMIGVLDGLFQKAHTAANVFRDQVDAEKAGKGE